MSMPSASRIAYLGPEGTFAEQATSRLQIARYATLLPHLSVSTALDAVRQGSADYAVVPLENSVEGSVASTLDELIYGDPLVVEEEIYLSVQFSLLARSAVEVSTIATLATHPHAEAQCRGWLRSRLPHAQIELAPSTAAAAAGVADGRYDAAIAAPIAAPRYELTELATDIEDNPGAVTRFVLLSRRGRPPNRTGNDKTSLVAFIREDHTGALLEVLAEFAVRGINLTRIESRPMKEQLGRYCFSIDCEGHIADARVGEALSALHRICADVRYLGSYPRADGKLQPLRSGTSDESFAEAAQWLATMRTAEGNSA